MGEKTMITEATILDSVFLVRYLIRRKQESPAVIDEMSRILLYAAGKLNPRILCIITASMLFSG